MCDDMDIVFGWIAENLSEERGMPPRWDMPTLAGFFKHASDYWSCKWRATVIPADVGSPVIFEFRGPADERTARKIAERRAGRVWDRVVAWDRVELEYCRD